MAVPFAEKAAQTGLYNANGLLNYLKECYTDPDASQRALERLCRIRQGDNKPFAAFLHRFERELIESCHEYSRWVRGWSPDKGEPRLPLFVTSLSKGFFSLLSPSPSMAQ